MTESTGQTGTEESTGTAQAAPPPFHVPDGSTCVADCDDAPLGWSTPTVGATNLPTGAQGGGGDMIGCWQVAQTADPHGDSETSSDEEIMQLYVSADGSGSNEGLWFRVRDGSFTSWTSLISAPTSPPAATDALAGLVERATQSEADAGTDNERYMTPSLVKRRINAIPRPSSPPSASTSRAGIVERATTTEADAGSDNERYMTPSLVRRRINVLRPVRTLIFNTQPRPDRTNRRKLIRFGANTSWRNYDELEIEILRRTHRFSRALLEATGEGSTHTVNPESSNVLILPPVYLARSQGGAHGVPDYHLLGSWIDNPPGFPTRSYGFKMWGITYRV